MICYAKLNEFIKGISNYRALIRLPRINGCMYNIRIYKGVGELHKLKYCWLSK